MPVELLRFDMLLPAFALVLARVAGVFLAVPMFSSSQMPVQLKALIIFAISLSAFPGALPHLPAELTLGTTVAGMAGEFIIGEVLGFGAGIAFFAAQIAGKLVSHQSGMALGEVFNPVFDSEATVLDEIWFFTATAVFLALRGHLALMSVLMESFRDAPPLMAHFDGTVVEFAVSVLDDMFDLALRLAGPAVLALLLSSLVMGFLTKTMPQLNILSVGFSVKVAIALFMLAVTVAASESTLADAIFRGLDKTGAFLQTLSRGAAHGG